MLRLDHLAVGAADLEAGVAGIEAALGVALAPGGRHGHMATHNRLLGLGDIYLEVIAPDPDAPRPAWPRWFRLDEVAPGAPLRLSNWICACDDLDAALGVAPAGAGAPVALSRGDLAWRMAVPGDGRLPFDDAFPALIQWQGTAHPAQRLADVGVRLRRLVVAHPEAAALRVALAGLGDARVVVETGASPALAAEFDTPHGLRRL